MQLYLIMWKTGYRSSFVYHVHSILDCML